MEKQFAAHQSANNRLLLYFVLSTASSSGASVTVRWTAVAAELVEKELLAQSEWSTVCKQRKRKHIVQRWKSNQSGKSMRSLQRTATASTKSTRAAKGCEEKDKLNVLLVRGTGSNSTSDKK